MAAALGSDGSVEAEETETAAMASFKKSFESLKGTSQSAGTGVTDAAVKAAQEAVQQVADSSKETVGIAAQEVNKETQAAIGQASDKAIDTIKELGGKLDTK